MTSLLRLFIHLYRLTLSALIGRECRFVPTCSAYALEALDEYGALKSFQLIVKRIARCHPWSKGGLDLVPPKEKK